MKKFPRKARQHFGKTDKPNPDRPKADRAPSKNASHKGDKAYLVKSKDTKPFQRKQERTFEYAEGPEDRRRPRFSRELAVLYEDDAVIVLNKPAGLLAVPIKGSATISALSLLQDRLKPRRERVYVVHRIDRFASGILLFAKTGGARDTLVRQFLAHSPVRRYLVVVRGSLKATAKPVTLVHHFRRQGLFQQERTARDPHATRAELRYTVERQLADATLVRVELITGLQNQIRAQFSALGNPVIGDRKYHRAEASEKLIDRVALHAEHLEFVHPRTGEKVTIDCPPPADFERLIRELGRGKR